MEPDKNDNFANLTPEEERVILHKGTEAPFSGEYDNFYEEGMYLCKRCRAPLFNSKAKFDAGCGWPAFDDEVNASVARVADADGMRIEIVCANCGAHLGHVFTGEGMTEKDTRHCVNSLSMVFLKAGKEKEIAYFAGGCFWGVEYYLKELKGVISTRVGFMGGGIENPTYEQVCNLDTGHAEVVEVVFDPGIVTYEEVAKLFFEIHDPTQVNRQGPDVGEQYRSVVFYADDGQKRIAEKLISILKAKGLEMATKVEKATMFYPAEEYHQKYYDKNGKQPYCHTRVKRF